MLQAGLEMNPESNVIKSLQAVCAAQRGDAGAVEALAQGLQDAWAPDHSSTMLLKGLFPAARKDLAAAVALYGPYAARQAAVDWPKKHHNERRVMSVNLYFMARTLAGLGGRAEAQPILDLADRLHTGKKKVAAQDPAFKA
jgi:hypothetical protein